MKKHNKDSKILFQNSKQRSKQIEKETKLNGLYSFRSRMENGRKIYRKYGTQNARSLSLFWLIGGTGGGINDQKTGRAPKKLPQTIV